MFEHIISLSVVCQLFHCALVDRAIPAMRTIIKIFFIIVVIKLLCYNRISVEPNRPICTA